MSTSNPPPCPSNSKCPEIDGPIHRGARDGVTNSIENAPPSPWMSRIAACCVRRPPKGWNPSPTALHTGCTTQHSTSRYGTPTFFTHEEIVPPPPPALPEGGGPQGGTRRPL